MAKAEIYATFTGLTDHGSRCLVPAQSIIYAEETGRGSECYVYVGPDRTRLKILQSLEDLERDLDAYYQGLLS